MFLPSLLLFSLSFLSLFVPPSSSSSRHTNSSSLVDIHSVSASMSAAGPSKKSCVSVGDEVQFTVAVSSRVKDIDIAFKQQFDGSNFVLRPGSVSSNLKDVSVRSGNGHKDNEIHASFTIPEQRIATISFTATVKSPFPVGPSIASLQGSVSFGDGLFVLTTDSSAEAATTLCVDTKPHLDIQVTSRRDESKGGKKLYEVSLRNDGNQVLGDVSLLSRVNEDFSFSHVSTEPKGFEIASFGKKVFVMMGKLNVNEEVVVTLELPIPQDYPLSNLRENFRAYFTADGKNRLTSAVHMKAPHSVSSDDPSEDADDIFGGMNAILTAKLLYDADNDAMADPGDIIQYSLVVVPASKKQPIDFEIQLPSMLSLAPSSIIAPSASFKEIRDHSILHLKWAPSQNEVHSLFSAVVGSYLPGEFTQVCVQGTINGELPTSTWSMPEGPTCMPIDGFTKVYASKRLLFRERVDQSDNSNGGASQRSPYIHAGEEVTYHVHIENSGSRSATNTQYQVELEHMSYVPDSFLAVGGSAKPKGIFSHGPTLRVDIGDLSGLSSYDFQYRAMVDNPLLYGVSQISAQGEVVFETRSLVGSGHVTGKQVVRTDDPTTVVADDATVAAVLPSDCDFESSVVSLEADASSDVPVGGEIEYTVHVDLKGSIHGEVYYINEMPLGLNLVVGSVVIVKEDCSSLSSSDICCNILEGNNYGDKRVVVLIVGGSLTLTYRAVVSDPFNGPESQIRNQGSVMIDGKVKYSDDPNTLPLGDPTVTALTISDLQYTDVIGVMTASLEVDVNHDGVVDPGDTLRYTVEIYNQGTLGAAGVVFHDTLDPHTTLVVGTTTSTCGEIVNGNTAAEYASSLYRAGSSTEDVVVIVGGLVPHLAETCTITFDAQVNPSLPSTTTYVSNQGLLTGINFDSLVTTDGSGAWDAPTVVPVAGIVSYSFTKSASVSLDWNWNGKAEPGDGIKYTIVFHNYGSHDMTSARFSDYPDLNTKLVVGSVTSTAGKIQTGNRLGDDEVVIDIASIPARTGSFTVTFMVTINDPFTGTANAVYNQASLSAITYSEASRSSGRVTLVTSDDSTTIVDDPTTTVVVASPEIHVVTHVDFKDANADGAVNPGETLVYTITVSNKGNQDAIGVVITDTPDPNTRLVVGSVVSSHGHVAVGNSVKDDGLLIQINGGDLSGHTGSITYSFSVVVNKEFAGGANISNTVTVEGQNFISSTQTSTDVEAPVLPVNLQLIQTWELYNDADESGDVTPGDTLLFSAKVTNVGGGVAHDAAITASIDPNAPLVVGSVSVSPFGSVTSGNEQGDTHPMATLGAIVGFQFAELNFMVTVASTMPAWVSSISSQAVVSGSNFESVVSTDPTQRILFYPTIVPVYSAPSLVFTKTWALNEDYGQNGVVDPGDVVQYTLTIENVGNQAAVDVMVTDVPPTTVSFVAGSVVASAGEVIYGNGADLPSSADAAATGANNKAVVSVPEIAGEVVTITFNVLVPSPFLGVEASVSNQASLTGGNVPSMTSDDPTNNFINDPTVFPVDAQPSWQIETLFETTNPLPGAGQVFTSVITNDGNQQAYDIVVSYDFGGYWSIDSSQPVVFSPSTCCDVVYTETGAHDGPTLSRVVLSVNSASVPVGSNFSVQMNIIGDLGTAPRRCSRPTTSSDLSDCLTIEVTVSGSQFPDASVSVVEQSASSRRGSSASGASAPLIPNIPMVLGTTKRVSQEIVGVDGSFQVFAVSSASNDGRRGTVSRRSSSGTVLQSGDKVHVVARGYVHTRYGTPVATFDALLDSSLVLLPESVSVSSAEAEGRASSSSSSSSWSAPKVDSKDHALTVSFFNIPGSDEPSAFVVAFDALVIPNFDGVLRLENKATISIGSGLVVNIPVDQDEASSSSSPSSQLSVQGFGRRSTKEHMEYKSKMVSLLSSQNQGVDASHVIMVGVVVVGICGLVIIAVGSIYISIKKVKFGKNRQQQRSPHRFEDEEQ